MKMRFAEYPEGMVDSTFHDERVICFSRRKYGLC